jgi:hypothetical protein
MWFQAGTEDFSLLQSVQTGPPILLSGDTRDFSAGIRWPWHEADPECHLVQGLRMSGVIPPLHVAVWHAQGEFYLLFDDIPC